MPLQWFAGFEAGDLAEMVSSTSASIGTAYKRSGLYGCRLTVPTGTTSVNIALANGYDASGNPTTATRTTYTLGFGFRVIALPQTAGQWEHLVFVALSTTHRASLRLGQDGTLRLHIGAVGSAYIASFGPVELNRWYYCDLAVLADRFIWRMDGRIVAQGPAAPGGTMSVAYLGKRFNLTSQGYTVDIDDLYTCDDATLFGPTARVVRCNPNANGTSSSWNPSTPEQPV